MTTRATLLILSTFYSFSFFAQIGGGYSAKEIETIIENNNPAPISKTNWTSEDSLRNIPAHHIYKKWDTWTIHPYQLNLETMKDTVRIKLVNNLEKDYHVPYKGDKTSEFGVREGRFHNGTDIRLKTGDKIYSAFSGVVRIAHHSQSYGNVIVVRHANGLETLYAHLSKRKVRAGDKVTAGDVIGLGGNTGHSSGPHLHFECLYKGEPINSNYIIDWSNGKLKRQELLVLKETLVHVKKIKEKLTYTVKSGDTLIGISNKVGVPLKTILFLNKMKMSDNIIVGKVIRLSF